MDDVCKVCHKVRGKVRRQAVTGHFGPLPRPAGSEKWVSEVWRRAGVIRAERGLQRHPEPTTRRRFSPMAERPYRVAMSLHLQGSA